VTDAEKKARETEAFNLAMKYQFVTNLTSLVVTTSSQDDKESWCLS
jgi:hypothetical protein